MRESYLKIGFGTRAVSVFNFPKDLKDLLHGGLLKLFAAALQRFGEFDGGILHPLVRLVGTTNEKKMLAAREPLVSVLVVQPKAEETHHATVIPILVLRHRARSRRILGLAPYLTRIYVSPEEPVNCNPPQLRWPGQDGGGAKVKDQSDARDGDC